MALRLSGPRLKRTAWLKPRPSGRVVPRPWPRKKLYEGGSRLRPGRRSGGLQCSSCLLPRPIANRGEALPPVTRREAIFLARTPMLHRLTATQPGEGCCGIDDPNGRVDEALRVAGHDGITAAHLRCRCTDSVFKDRSSRGTEHAAEPSRPLAPRQTSAGFRRWLVGQIPGS